MAKDKYYTKHKKPKKFSVRHHNRCAICGRPRGYMRRFDMCKYVFESCQYR
jgi:small subunit ribosomal protein S14